MSHTAILFLAAFVVLNTEHQIHGKPTSIPPVPLTNTSASVPGECEVFPPGECQSFPSDECENDQQCQDIYTEFPSMKCCRNYCGTRVCDLPGNNKQQTNEVEVLVCPVQTEQEECPSDIMNECNEDSECGQLYPGEGLMCCRDSCGENYCEQPVLRLIGGS